AAARVAGGRVRPLGGARIGLATAAGGGDRDVARIAHAVRELGLERARALGTFAFERFEDEFRAPEALAYAGACPASFASRAAVSADARLVCERLTMLCRSRDTSTLYTPS